MSKESATAMLTESTLNGVTPPVAPETPPATDINSTRFAHLAKKESEFVKRQEIYKKEKADFEAEKQKYLSSHDRITKFDELKSKNAREALQFAGFTDTDIINIFADMEDKSTPEERATKAAALEIQKFKDEQTKVQQDEASKKNASVIKKFRNDISTAIETNKDKFEYCNFYGPIAQELIYETVASVLQTDKELISIEEAAQMVESHYEEQDKAMSNLNKRKPKDEAIQEAKDKIEALKPEMPGSSRPKTLSNRTAASVASAKTAIKETPSQKRERLIERLRNGG